jgi:hypothetical protein
MTGIKGVSAAEGGERACNSHPAYVDGEMLAVTKIVANAWVGAFGDHSVRQFSLP